MHLDTLSTEEQFDLKRTELIEDVDRRKREAAARLELLRRQQFELMNQATQAAEMGSVDTSIRLKQQAQAALAEFRRLDHLVIPGLQTEFEQIQNGTHSALAVLGMSMASRTRVTQRQQYEEAQQSFAKLLTPELKVAARRLVELSTAHLETPDHVVTAIANA